MKELGLIAKYGRPRIKNVYTCKETSEKYVSENIYNEMQEEEQDKVNAWAIDFTEQRTAEKKVYTCAIIDIKRKVLAGNKQSFKMPHEAKKIEVEYKDGEILSYFLADGT